jgi:hypothetical protein
LKTKSLLQGTLVYQSGGFMALKIVWRNPIPPAKRERRVEPVAVDEFGAMCAVRTADKTAAFDLIFGGAA